MKLSQFKFKLPEEQVAIYPAHKTFENEDGSIERVYSRDACRLMIVHRKSGVIDMTRKDGDGNALTTKDGSPAYHTFREVLDYFKEDDTFIFNDTKVFPARYFGTKEKTDAKIEVFLLRELSKDQRLWDVLVEPARKIRIGNKLFFDKDGPMVAEVIDNTTNRGRTLRFLYDCPHEEFKRELFKLGEAPLPKYIVSRRGVEKDDNDNFQTIYAANEGAVTAPSSGLHFSREMMKMMEIRGIRFAFVTLHCGLNNFDPIEVEDLSKHKVSSERMIIASDACDTVNAAKKEERRICAVGVTTARATETAVGTDGFLKEYDGWTNKFIFPPYEFSLANCMITNFYHPESVMLIATAAFGGYDLIMEAYRQALDNGYMFGCYGDAMLILDD